MLIIIINKQIERVREIRLEENEKEKHEEKMNERRSKFYTHNEKKNYDREIKWIIIIES